MLEELYNSATRALVLAITYRLGSTMSRGSGCRCTTQKKSDIESPLSLPCEEGAGDTPTSLPSTGITTPSTLHLIVGQIRITILFSGKVGVIIMGTPSRLQNVAVLRVTQVTPSRRGWWLPHRASTPTTSTDRGYVLASTCQCSSLPCTKG